MERWNRQGHKPAYPITIAHDKDSGIYARYVPETNQLEVMVSVRTETCNRCGVHLVNVSDLESNLRMLIQWIEDEKTAAILGLSKSA